MKNTFLLMLIAFFSTRCMQAQLSLSALGSPATIDFTGYGGTGFSPTPSATQLNSNTWSVNGMSDGLVDFGGTATTGDFARGSTTGGVTTGGIYALEYNGGNQAIWIQPTADDFTSGALKLQCQNISGSTISSIDVNYHIIFLNDQGRSSFINFYYSTDDSVYTAVPLLNYTTPAAPDILGLVLTLKTTSITNLTLANGDFFYLMWTSGDLSGSGSRDEIGFDNISLTPQGASVCLTPSAVTVGNITSTSAKLVWTAVAGALSYKIQYRPYGTTTWLLKTAIGTQKNLTSLQPNTVYQYRIRTKCTNSNSAYSSIQSFSTLPLKLESYEHLSVSISPNPVTDFAQVTVTNDYDQQLIVRVMDLAGRIIEEKISLGPVTMSLGLSDEPSGCYLILVSNSEETIIKKVMKQ